MFTIGDPTKIDSASADWIPTVGAAARIRTLPGFAVADIEEVVGDYPETDPVSTDQGWNAKVTRPAPSFRILTRRTGGGW